VLIGFAVQNRLASGRERPQQQKTSPVRRTFVAVEVPFAGSKRARKNCKATVALQFLKVLSCAASFQ